MHRRMLDVAQAVPESSRPDVARFLDAMADCLNDEDTVEDVEVVEGSDPAAGPSKPLG
jgi:hypothetical protein